MVKININIYFLNETCNICEIKLHNDKNAKIGVIRVEGNVNLLKLKK